MRRKLLFSSLLLFAASTSMVAQSPSEKTHGPDCSGGWPTAMTFVHLKNAGLADNGAIDWSNIKTARIASEKIGQDLWHQVYHVTFTRTSGGTIDAIAVHDASLEECSMTGVEVFVVSKHLSDGR
jgi:hypothetical protein